MKKLFIFLLAIFGLFLASCDINFENNNNASTDKKEDAVYEKTVTPQLAISDISRINYTIENVCEDIEECSVQILDSDGDIKVVYHTLTGIIRELDNNENYKLTGYYMGNINDKLYKVNIELTEINTKGYDNVLKLQKNKCVSNIYSNLFVVDTKPFIDAAPEGYSFAGITVTEKDGEAKDFDYNGQATICVKGLKPNTTYQVGSYYDRISKEKAKMSYKLDTSVTPGYRIRFVGFWVVSGDTSANKVEMVYNNEVLYTYYVEDGGSIYNPYNFILPEKYDGYYVVGSDKNLENITTDLVCNLVLAKENPTESFLVVFYDFNGNIFHSETVEYGKAAVGPTTTPPNYTVGSITYEFDKWDKDYSNITANIRIYPVKKDNTPKEDIPIVKYNNTLISNKYLSGGYKVTSGGNSVISTKVYLKDSSGNIYDIITEKNTNESYFVEYDSTKEYQLYTEIEYKLDSMTSSAFITKTQSINYTNINSIDQKNYSFDAAHETNRSMHVKVRYDDIDMIVRYVKVNDYHSYFYGFEVKDNLAIVNGLYPGYKYSLNYAFKDDTDQSLYYVSSSTFEIETMSKAEFGLEEVKIEYFQNNNEMGHEFILTFVGDKAEEILSEMYGFNLHGTIIENGQDINPNIGQVMTGTYDDGRKYAYAYCHVDMYNPETGQFMDYEYHISQIMFSIDDEGFDYHSTDKFEETENGYIQYYECRADLAW